MFAWQNNCIDFPFQYRSLRRSFVAAQRKTLPKVFKIIINLRNLKAENTVIQLGKQ